MLLKFTRHKRIRCTCSGDRHCMFCDGGLFACETCGGAEGSLTTHCPQEKVDGKLLDAVYNSELDFVNGEWKEKVARANP